ncbi:acetylornithine deacetylase/succinyl-diaminopimelate desuccinylase-like protein [Nocardia tenerifensis]|uniref:Acetylornithine deacetylase/succinyl-diaminopimelate desuccinylase-like protein n=1 Tax=Nocardia tenerifensis TaxID=228006 RepID=A0A318KA56_9NOCA|nr:dipeptidase [Nocardia tenerifensis]PXX66876.1 acetylornithine deacetylase/succinyl-diaminopimelate desuccinylase-like protein [Nocardia tenerifensis]
MTDDSRTAELRAKVAALMPQAKTDLTQLVSFKSVADARQFPPSECERAAQWVADAFVAAGLTRAGLHETPDGSKAVIAARPAPPGAPTVLLYCHYDVQPPLDSAAWRTPVWELTEQDGRWYGRGSADCKGNIVMHLTALRALGPELPLGVMVVAEGSEEQGTGGLERFVEANPDLLRADAILIGDCGNFAAGVPTLTETLRGNVNVVVTVRTLASSLHSGMFGGAAPDALAALIHLLATLRDEHGNTTVAGLPNDQRWTGVQYPPEQFRTDAGVLGEVELLGDGTVSDMLWARPALTVLGIDAPPVVGSAAAVQASARARLNLRIPPGTDPEQARKALVAHLEANTPWQAELTVELEGTGAPFRSRTGGPARAAMEAALAASYGRPATTQGQGGSIPLCNVFADTYPDAEIMLLGVEEPACLIHAPNESVDPAEIEHMALAEALFLSSYAERSSKSPG